MADGTSGLSKKERAVLQNDCEFGNDRDYELDTWQWRIAKKVQATVSDVRLMLLHQNDTVNIVAPLMDCRDDLVAIRDHINMFLNAHFSES